MIDTPTLPVESDNLTKPEPFEPTPGMLLWIDTAIDIVSDSPSKISEACKMSRQTWYDWLKIPGFEDWYYEQYKNKRKRWLPTLDRIGMMRSERDYNYWKDMNKKLGELEDKQGPSTLIQNNFNAGKYIKEK